MLVHFACIKYTCTAKSQSTDGNLHLLLNDGYLKQNDYADFEKHAWLVFPNTLRKGVYFQNI